MAEAKMFKRSVFNPEDFLQQYHRGKNIKSSYSKVYEGYRKADNKPVFIKVLDKYYISTWEEYNGEMIPLQVAVLLKLIHVPGVVKILDYYDDDCYFTFIMESGGTQNMLQYASETVQFQETTAKPFFWKIVESLWACREAGIFHRDIKFENIVLDENSVTPTIIGFGFAAYAGKEAQGFPEMKCSPIFLLFPPECIQGSPYEGNTATVWALGLLLYRMIFYEKFINSKSEITTLGLHLPSTISQNCQDLLTKCLQKDPSKRLQFNKMLHHPWFK